MTVRRWPPWIALLPAAGPTAAALVARRAWWLDGWTAFVPYALAAAVVGLLVAAVAARKGRGRGRWAAVVVAAGLVAWNGWRTAAEWGGGPTGGEAAVSLMAANVKTANRDFGRFLDVVRADPPDVLAVLETDAGWCEALEGLADVYPHRYPLPRPDNFGMTLLSKRPWAGVEVLELGDRAMPAIAATFAAGAFGRPLTVLATHPVPPVRRGNWRRRNRQLAATAAWAAEVEGAVAVAGDLNTPPWSPFYADLLRAGRLADARRAGEGLSATWDARRWWMSVPIDSILTRGVRAAAYRTGPATGSDHLPVRAELAWE